MASWCPNCGRQIEEGEKFCRSCGMPLDLSDEQASRWIRSAPDPDEENLPRTRRMNPNPTAAPNAQTGPAYIPPVNAPSQPVWQANYYEQPQPPQYYPPAQTGQSNIRLGDWLSGGWKLYSENAALMSVATLLATLLSICTLGILGGPLLMGLYRMAFKTMRQERPELNDLFNWGDRFWQAFLAFFIFGLINFGVLKGTGFFGSVLSPFLITVIGLTIPLMLERRQDVANAINDVGRKVFSKDALMWWIVGLVFSALSVIGFVGCGVGVFVTVPWMISSAAVAYRDVFGVDDPNRTNA